jgi:hypothetical protein
VPLRNQVFTGLCGAEVDPSTSGGMGSGRRSGECVAARKSFFGVVKPVISTYWYRWTFVNRAKNMLFSVYPIAIENDEFVSILYYPVPYRAVSYGDGREFLPRLLCAFPRGDCGCALGREA